MQTIPGYVDHHAHFITYAAQYKWPTESDWFPALASHGSNPMDEPWPDRCSDGELPGLLRHALDDVARLGISQFIEAGLPDLTTYHALVDLHAERPLPVSVQILLASGLAESLATDTLRSLRSGDPTLDVIGVKFYTDGWLSLGNCALHEPFASTSDTGLLFIDATHLARRVTPFAEAGFKIATHAIGDRAISNVLDAYEIVFGGDLQACREHAPRIEHAEVLSPDLAQRMSEMGVVVCLQPSFAALDHGTAEQMLGSERAQHAHDWRMLLDHGVRLVTGSDAPMADPSPLVGLQHLIDHSGFTYDEALSLMTGRYR